VAPTPTGPQQQLALFQAPSSVGDRLAERLRQADLDRMTPLEALAFLADLKQDAQH
jgi:hypothetical protein